MCGIAGFWVTDDNRPQPSIIERQCDALHHRGPDGSGQYIDNDVAFGHRRLSIIDVDGGAQPIGNEDGSIQIVFNGEIYNFLELRKQLLLRGHQFSTHTDTEVLVHLYEERGEEMMSQIEGMFAFAIWDRRRGRVLLARDRFGKKPLYYSTDLAGTRLAFASELKALTCLPGFEASVDEMAVSTFLCLGYVPDPLSIYRNVKKLPPGHILVLNRNGGLRLEQFWALPFAQESTMATGEAVEALKAAAAEAVQCRMISDVPLGAFLSGGVDSSAVVALMSLGSKARVKTFSIGFTDAAHNELQYAREVVELYGTDHREEIVTPDVLRVFSRLITHFDEPFGDPSAVPMMYLSRLTAQHVTVALSGDGADEVFGGYSRYAWNLGEERLRQRFPEWFRSTVLRWGARHYPSVEYLPRIFRMKATLNFLSKELGDGYFTHMSVFRDEDVARYQSEDLNRKLGGYSPRSEFVARFLRHSELSPLQQMQAVDYATYLPGDILTKVDRATMAYSLEARCPWLDHRLAEIAGQIPSSLKLRNDVGKHIFKAALKPYLPQAVLTRRKHGFSVPLASWLRTSLVDVFEDLVFTPAMEQYLAIARIRKLWKQHLSGSHNHDRKLWNILVLAAWEASRDRDGLALADRVNQEVSVNDQ